MRFSIKLVLTWTLNILFGSIANIWIAPLLNSSFYETSNEDYVSDWFALFLGNILFSTLLSFLLLFALLAFYNFAKAKNYSTHKYVVNTYWLGTIMIAIFLYLSFDYSILKLVFAYIAIGVFLFRLILKVELYNFWRK